MCAKYGLIGLERIYKPSHLRYQSSNELNPSIPPVVSIFRKFETWLEQTGRIAALEASLE